MRRNVQPVTTGGDSPFLWVYRVGVDGTARPLVDADPPKLEASGEAGFLWIHLNTADLRVRQWVAAQEAIPAEAKASLISPDTHQSLNGDGSSLWGVLVDYGRDFEQDEDIIRQLRIVATDRFVISARRYPVQSAAAVRRAMQDGASFAHPLDLFEMIVDRILTAMNSAAERLVGDLNVIEDDVLDAAPRDERRRLASLRRSLIRLHRQITGTQRVFARLEHSPRMSPQAHAVVQRLTQELDSLHQELHATNERARLLQDESVSKLTTETNRQLYILTILGTLLMPPTLITGVFGMNTKGLLFAENENGFIYAMLICAASAIAALFALYWMRTPPGDKAPRRRDAKINPKPHDVN
jgi:zinc transporter